MSVKLKWAIRAGAEVWLPHLKGRRDDVWIAIPDTEATRKILDDAYECAAMFDVPEQMRALLSLFEEEKKP